MRNYDQKAEFLPTLWKHLYKQYGALYKFYCLYIIGCSGLLQNNLIWERIKQKDSARSFYVLSFFHIALNQRLFLPFLKMEASFTHRECMDLSHSSANAEGLMQPHLY